MLTKSQPLSSNEFHYGECRVAVGARGGRKVFRETYRRNGATQTWKTRPAEYRVPVVFGLHGYSQIREYDADSWHVPAECPLNDATRHPFWNSDANGDCWHCGAPRADHSDNARD